MKTKPSPKSPAPKARVIFPASDGRFVNVTRFPVLVRPYPTKQQAQGAAKWANLSYGAKAAALKDLFPSNWTDPILTGPNTALKGAGGTWGCPDVERLIKAIRDDATARILQLLGEQPTE